MNILFPFPLQNSFIDELLQLIVEDDVRVREHASKCLCNFILQNAKHTSLQLQQQQSQNLQQKKLNNDYQNDKIFTNKTYKQNLNLLMNFLDYSIFNDMSPALRSLLNSQQEQLKDILTSLDATSSFTFASLASFNMDLPKREEIEAVLSKVLYRLTNRLMSLKDKNMQVNISKKYYLMFIFYYIFFS